jgi:polysaccharide chain length determinant protein (PEP-CTERM system associated)
VDKIYLKEMLNAVKSELIRFRIGFMIFFIAISFSVLLVGLSWPKRYATSVTLVADETNIIEPLLKGNAEVSKIDRSEQAQQFIHTRGVLYSAAKESGLINNDMSADEQDRIVKAIRAKLQLVSIKHNAFTLSYSSNDPDKTFETLNAVVKVFLADTEERKREESLAAFNFIDTQVQSYKQQLEMAEEKLKEFNSGNLDGSREAVTSRLSQLRSDIENLNIVIEESVARVKTLQQQLGNEGQYQRSKGKADELKARRSQLNSQLATLLLDYKEDYPDIISMRAQLATINTEIQKLEASGEIYVGTENLANPLYDELRKQHSIAELELQSQKRRMESLLKLQQQEAERAQRVAEGQARYSELTRDYDVLRKVYEEMLSKKETARVSMTLNVEGQGVSYRIQEPAVFPLRPTGLVFIHFAIIGPLLGLLFPFGLIVAYVLLDPHFRSSRVLISQIPSEIELLGVIPHYNTPLGDRLLRKDMVIILSLSIISMIIYVALVVFWQTVKA